MSRGPGKWQRAILDALAASEWRYLHELVPKVEKRRYTWVYSDRGRPEWGPKKYRGFKRSDRIAIMRAAHVLARHGKITLATSRSPSSPTVVARPGVAVDEIMRPAFDLSIITQLLDNT